MMFSAWYMVIAACFGFVAGVGVSSAAAEPDKSIRIFFLVVVSLALGSFVLLLLFGPNGGGEIGVGTV